MKTTNEKFDTLYIAIQHKLTKQIIFETCYVCDRERNLFELNSKENGTYWEVIESIRDSDESYIKSIVDYFNVCKKYDNFKTEDILKMMHKHTAYKTYEKFKAEFDTTVYKRLNKLPPRHNIYNKYKEHEQKLSKMIHNCNELKKSNSLSNEDINLINRILSDLSNEYEHTYKERHIDRLEKFIENNSLLAVELTI